MIKINLTPGFSLEFTSKVLTILLLIIQSCGIRFVDGQGTFLTVVVLFLSRSGFNEMKKRDLINLIVIFSFLVFSALINDGFPFGKLIFQFGLILEAYVFLLSYRRNYRDLISDFYKTLSIIFVHAALGYLVYFLISGTFSSTSAFGYPYQTFALLFYVTEPLNGFARNTGILWEPGLLQLMMNIFLFYCIQRDKPYWLLVLVVVTVLTTSSTTGYFNLGLNYLYFIYHNFKRNRKAVISLIVITIVFSSSIFFISDNIGDKLSGDNTSGLARYRDYLIGVQLISESPILGHGLFDREYLISKSFVKTIESNVFTKEYLDISEQMSGGFTNGLLAFFSWYGIPIGLATFYFFFRNKFLTGGFLERLFFFLIISTTLASEPITYTAFFLIFPLSFLVFPKHVSTLSNKR
jgi:hypothetical protein